MKASIIEKMCKLIESLGNIGYLNDINTTTSNLTSMAVGSGVFTGLQTVAAMLITFYFLIHMVESTLRDKSDPDAIFKDLALAFFYMYLVTNMGTLVTAMDGMCSNIVKTVQDGVASVFGTASDVDLSGFTSTLSQQYADTKLVPLVFDYCLYYVFGRLASWIIKGIAYLALFTCKLEIIVRTLLLPVAVGSIPDGGWQGAGGRNIKRWIGTYLQLAVIAAAIAAYPYVLAMSAGTGNDESAFVAVIAAGFAAAGMCMKANSLAHEVAGAA